MDLTDGYHHALRTCGTMAKKQGRNLNELQRAQEPAAKTALRFVFVAQPAASRLAGSPRCRPPWGGSFQRWFSKFTPRKDLSEYEKAVDVFPVAGAAWRRGISSPAVAALHRF